MVGELRQVEKGRENVRRTEGEGVLILWRMLRVWACSKCDRNLLEAFEPKYSRKSSSRQNILCDIDQPWTFSEGTSKDLCKFPNL